MRKNFAEKKIITTKNSRRRWRVIFLLMLGLVLTMSTVFVVKKQKIIWHSSFLTTYVTRINVWIAARKNSSANSLAKQNLDKLKSLTSNKSTPPSIHFEFYTALPNMQVVIPSQTFVSAEEKSETEKQRPAKSLQIKKSKTIVSENEVADILSLETQQHEFVLQIAVFKNAKAAERLAASFSDAGFAAGIARLMVANKEIYRVQFGPFSTEDQARVAQKKLQKKGINGVLKII